MTSDPAAPGAPAVYLFLEQTADDQTGQRIFYARIKILTPAGREQFSDITIPYEDKEEKIRDIEARTIHSDGTVIPFTGKPWQKEVAKGGGVRFMEKGFSLPDVQVGSILEYRYETTYDDWWAPHWYLQQSIPVRQSHYHFRPAVNANVASVRFLPTGAQMTEKNGEVDLALSNVPAVEDEDDAPPSHAIVQRMLFYYTRFNIVSANQYWETRGLAWSAAVDQFLVPVKLKDAVAQIVAPGDSDDLKLRKIYAAVMKLENTRFTRERSQQENKRLKLKVRDVADIWLQQRGTDDEIAFLFIGLARAAGLKAYAMMVTRRDRNVFSDGVLDWGQLDDVIAIVSIGGKDQFFDPGERYCEYGQLHWIHAASTGVRQTDKGTEIAPTPALSYKDNVVARNAALNLAADGSVSGTIQIALKGAAALRWRQEVLLTDEQEAQKTFEDELQKAVPDGVNVKMNHFAGLTDSSAPLMAVFDVSGHLGTRTGKRLLLPSALFEARLRPRFATEKRHTPVDLRYAFSSGDNITLKLAPGLAIETVPDNLDLPMGRMARYSASYQSANGVLEERQNIAIGNIFYKVEDYPQLRDFFQKTGAQNQTQLILTVTSPSPQTASSTSQ